MASTTTEVATGEWGSFSTSLVTNLIILIALLVGFFIIRSWRKNAYLYQPQYYDSVGKGVLQIPELPRSPFGFLGIVARYPSERVLQIRGLDSYMYLQVIKTFFIMFLCFLPIGIALLITLDVTADGPNEGIPEIGMANLAERSNRLYAHAVVLDLYTIIALYLLYRLYRKYTELRTQWFRNDEAHNYTVMFKRLNPQDLLRTPRHQYFSSLFPRNNITGPHYVAEDDFRFEVIKERDLQQKELDRVRGAFAQTGVRPMHKPRMFTKKVDSIEHHERVIATCNDMLTEHGTMFARDPSYSRVGFVTYGSIAEAANVVKSAESAPYKAIPAPQETDIFWQRLNRSTTVTVAKRLIVFVIILALVFLWTIPIIFIQGIANLENLSRISAFRWLNGVNSWGEIPKGLIQQYLPALFVIVFLALVPKIIAALMKWRGVATESELSRQIFKKYFFFQLWNVFLVSMWAGGIFSVLQQLSDLDGWALASSLGAGVAAGTLFFINYVLVYTLFKLPFGLYRIGDLIKAYLKRHSAVTEEQKRDIQRPEGFRFDTGYVILVLLFIICFCYSTLNAFIIPFAIIFFGVEYFIAKYMLTWVYFPKWDSGGRHWPTVFNRIIASMLISHIILIIVLVLRRSESAAVLAPAPILTIIFAIWIHRRYDGINFVLADSEYPSSNNGIAFARNYEDPVTKDNPMSADYINQGMNQGINQGVAAAGAPSGSGLSRRSSLRSSANDLAKARSPALRSSPRLRSPGLRKSGGSVYNELSNEDN